MKKSKQHRSAIFWVKKGIPVFPCEAGGKKPTVKHGFKDATTDLGQIDRWWEINPEFNLATCPEDSGFCVIDVDDKPGKFGSDSLALLEMLHGDLPPTRTTSTPSGGRHLWFKGSLASTTSKLGKDIDTRGVGGYILLPGSWIDGVPYTLTGDTMAPIPEWVKEGTFKKNIKERAVTDKEDEPQNISRARTYLKGLVDRGDVAIEGEASNDKYYQVFCHMKDFGLSEGLSISLVEEIWNPHCEPPHEEDALETMVEHVWKYSQNEEGSKGITDPLKTYEGITIPSQESKKAPKSDPLSPFYPRSEAEQDARPDPDWIIQDRIPELSTVMYYGSPGSYKSFVVLDEVLGVTHGRAGFDMKTKIEPMAVVYAAGEAARGIEKKRRPAWRMAHEIDYELPFWVISTVPWINQPGQFESFIEQIEAKNIKPGLIIFDTLARAMVGMNENDAMDAGQVIAAIDAVRDHFNCTIILIHHSGKDESRGARGSIAFTAGFDVIYEVTAAIDTRAAKIVCKKMKDAEEAPDLYLKGYSYKLPKGGDSLMFRPVRAGEFRELTRSQYDVSRQEVGKALIKLKAFSDKGVPTKVLASELIPFIEDETEEDHYYRESLLVRRLNKRAKGDLRAYLVSHPEDTNKWGALDQEDAPETEPVEEGPAWSD